MLSVQVSPAGRLGIGRGINWPVVLELPEEATVEDVKRALSMQAPKFYPARQKLTQKESKTMLTDETRLDTLGSTELAVKDLGPQISWHTVFLVEYAGPLIIHPLIYNFPETFYRGPVQHSLLQKYTYTLVILHFLKREFETLYVHRFSHATMPARNIFKNSAHYHLFSGLFLAYAIYSPTYSASSPYIRGTHRNDPLFLLGCSAAWAFAELSNLWTHIALKNLRPAGTKERAIPYGYGFDFVSCPNYFFEMLSWVLVSVMTGSYAAWFFTALSTYQMAVWAKKKHRGYMKEFGDAYPKGRAAMIPFIF